MFWRVRRQFRETGAQSGRVAVLVLGMHRSGTSSVAGALMRLGGGAPLHLMEPQPDNDRGFWESSPIVALNDEILAAGGSEWRDWRKFDFGRIHGSAARKIRARAKSLLMAEFGEAPLPVIKDPRMCRLVPFWSKVLRDAHWPVRAVMPLRSPLEVARSLNRRDGVGLSCGALIWLRHVLEAEAETRGMPRAVLSWREFLEDRRGALQRVGEHLDVSWPRWGDDAFAEIDAYVSADLWHHRASAAELRSHPAINDAARATYAAMRELVRDAHNAPAQKRLDELRAQFDRSGGFFDGVIRELQDEIRRLRSGGAEEPRELLIPETIELA